MAIRGRGIKSSAQDNFLQPDNVTSLTATDVGTNRPYLATANTTSAASAAGTGGSVTLSWSLPAASPAATEYIITTTPSTYTHNTGSSSTSYTFQGLASNTSYTFTVKGTNAAGTASGTTSSSVTATTVPQAPQSPTATAGVNQNTISWTLGANGGKALSSHDVTGSDGTSSTGLSGSATSTTINDTAGTSQTYTIVAKNANGTSTGATTSSVTTLSPFFPYFPFFPHFPYFPYFAPPPPPPPPPFFPFFPFFPYFYGFESVSGTTGILTTDGVKNASELVVGDSLIAMNIDGIDRNTMEWLNWSQENPVFNQSNIVETQIISITTNQVSQLYSINGDLYSSTHWILVKENDLAKFIRVTEVNTSHKVFSYSELGFVNVTSAEVLDVEDTIYSIKCEPYDNFFTQNMLVFDAFDPIPTDPQ